MIFDINKTCKLQKTSKYLTSNIKFIITEKDIKNDIIYLSYINDDENYFSMYDLNDFSYSISLYNFWLSNREKIYKAEDNKLYFERCEKKPLNIKAFYYKDSNSNIYGYFAPLILIPNDKPSHFIIFRNKNNSDIFHLKSLNDIRSNIENIEVYKVFRLDKFFEFENNLFYTSGEKILTYNEQEKRYYMNVVNILNGIYSTLYINEDEIDTSSIDLYVINLLYNNFLISRNFYNIEFLFESENINPKSLIGFYCKYENIREFLVDEEKTNFSNITDRINYSENLNLEDIDIDSDNNLLVLKNYNSIDKNDEINIVKSIDTTNKVFNLNQKINLNRYRYHYFLKSNILKDPVKHSIKFSIKGEKLLNVSNWIEIEHKTKKIRFILDDLSKCDCSKIAGYRKSCQYLYELYNIDNIEDLDIKNTYKVYKSNIQNYITVELDKSLYNIFDEDDNIFLIYNNKTINFVINKIYYDKDKVQLYIITDRNTVDDIENIDKIKLFYVSNSYEYCYIDIGFPYSLDKFYLSFKDSLKKYLGIDSIITNDGIIIFSNEKFYLSYDFTKSYYKYGNIYVNDTKMNGIKVNLQNKVEYRYRNKMISSIIDDNYKVALKINKTDIDNIDDNLYICYFKNRKNLDKVSINLPYEILFFNNNIINIPNDFIDCKKCISSLNLRNDKIYVQPYIYDIVTFKDEIIEFKDESLYSILLLNEYPVFNEGIILYKRSLPFLGYLKGFSVASI